jgi:hypothetical protein
MTSPEPLTPLAQPQAPSSTGALDPDHDVILDWRGLKITLTLARLVASFWLTVFFAVGCFWILLVPNNSVETNAAIAILSSIVTAWITALSRQR